MPDLLEELARETKREILREMSAEDLLQGLPSKERLKGLPPEKWFQGLSSDDLLRAVEALSPQIREELQQWLKAGKKSG